MLGLLMLVVWILIRILCGLGVGSGWLVVISILGLLGWVILMVVICLGNWFVLFIVCFWENGLDLVCMVISVDVVVV